MNFICRAAFACLLLVSIVTHAKTTMVVMDGAQLCAFYEDKNSCYQQALELISEYSEVGQFSADKRSCIFPSGASAVFKSSLAWMLKTYPAPYNPSWDFIMYKAPGRIAYELRTNGNYQDGFRISGTSKNGSFIEVTFNNINYAADSKISGTIKCRTSATPGESEYVVTSDALIEANALCPSTMPRQQSVLHLSTYYSAGGSKINVDAYAARLSNEQHNFFSCRNY